MYCIVGPAGWLQRANQAKALSSERRSNGQERLVQEITLRHGDVPGFMAAMTMDYSLPNAAVLDELQPGDRIAAQIAVDPADESHFWLEDVVITAEVARKRAARPEPSP